MILFHKKINFFLLSTTFLLLLTSCGSFDDEATSESGGSVSTSTSSSETGDGFVVAPFNGTFPHTASIVIGQNDFASAGDETTSSNTVSVPYGNPTVVDNTLYLPDLGNNRVLGYNGIPISNGKSADFSIGQEDLLSSDYGSSALQNNGVQTVTVVEGKLFVTDWGNNRILIYNRRPISGPGQADVVVGQSDFGQNGYATENNRLDSPESLYIVNNKLIVADSKNNRVLIWNSIPISNGVAADLVLGQSDFTSLNVINPPTASSLFFPTAVWSDGTQLIVLDAGNNRILVWNTFPTASNQNADVVLGQADFASNDLNQGLSTPSASTLYFATDEGGGLYSNGAQLFVADSGNNRVLVWDYPLTTAKAAVSLIGQVNFDRSGDNRETGLPASNSFSSPTGVYQFYNKLIVTDTGNNRYLIFYSN